MSIPPDLPRLELQCRSLPETGIGNFYVEDVLWLIGEVRRLRDSAAPQGQGGEMTFLNGKKMTDSEKLAYHHGRWSLESELSQKRQRAREAALCIAHEWDLQDVAADGLAHEMIDAYERVMAEGE